MSELEELKLAYAECSRQRNELLNKLKSQAQQEPVGCEGAIVNGRVYADRLEHDYKFECEAGPLHLCTDWVEFRRCFEWLAQHTSPPAQQEPVAFLDWYDNAHWGNEDFKAGCWRAWDAALAQRTWVSLTDEQVIKTFNAICNGKPFNVERILELHRAIEAKLKEKNCG